MLNTLPGRKRASTILLVEDESIIAMSEKATLERYGYQVHVVYTGEAAVEVALSDSSVSLVLMDIDLGSGIDGSIAAERILADRDVPIVFLSSHTEPQIVAKTEGITSYGYIVKDSGETVLIASIKMAFRLAEAKQEIKDSAAMLATMLEVSRNLVASLDLQEILQSSSDRLSDIAGLNAGAIYLVEDDSICIKATTPALPEEFPDRFRHASLEDHPHIRRAITERTPVFVPDTAVEMFTAREREVCDLRGLYSILYVPLVSREKAIGVYIAGATERPTIVRAPVVDLCVTLANMAAVAAENAMLFGG